MLIFYMTFNIYLKLKQKIYAFFFGSDQQYLEKNRIDYLIADA